MKRNYNDKMNIYERTTRGTKDDMSGEKYRMEPRTLLPGIK